MKTKYNNFVTTLDNHKIKMNISSFPQETMSHGKMNLYICALDYQYFQIFNEKNFFSHVTQSNNSKYMKTFCEPIITSREKITIDKEINGLEDLLCLIHENPLIDNVDYNIDMKTLHFIKPYLIDLNNMIGMKELKTNIVDQIIYYLQQFHTKGGNDFMHTVIYGPPGTGKTEIAKIIGRIFSKLGILKKGTFRKVTRSDLIAGYLGQTALKTRDAIQSALGGV